MYKETKEQKTLQTDNTGMDFTRCCTLADCTHEPTNEEQKIKNAKRGLFKNTNWGKLYDREAACLHGTPTYFCGCRWDNIEWCYECLNYAVKDKSTIQKIGILLKLKLINSWGWIKYIVRNIFSDKTLPF